MDIKSKVINGAKQLLQGLGFVIYALIALGTFTTSITSALLFAIVGVLLLPKAQEKLKNTYFHTPKRIGYTILGLTVFALVTAGSSTTDYSSKNISGQSVTEKEMEKALKLAEENSLNAKEEFEKNPDQVFQEISTYIENKNWEEVKTKTALLLETGDVEIKRLHDEAVAELVKEEEERQRKEKERLTTEFKDKRDTLIADLKKELSNKNYDYAQRIGTEYIEIADNEFKKLHDTAVEKQKAILEKEAIEAAAAPWSYYHTDDPMSKGKTHTATLSSSNTVEFGFPYGGTQHGRLTLRTDPKYGKDVIFKIEKGQILCPSYDSCRVLVRFDEENATSYTAVGAADNSTETIFIRNYSQFVEKMMKAKRVRISMNIYQEGAPVFDFDVSGFNVEKYKPK